jgi:hypothetical protein
VLKSCVVRAGLLVARRRFTGVCCRPDMEDIPVLADLDGLRIVSLVRQCEPLLRVWTLWRLRRCVDNCAGVPPGVQPTAGARDFGDEQVPQAAVLERVSTPAARRERHTKAIHTPRWSRIEPYHCTRCPGPGDVACACTSLAHAVQAALVVIAAGTGGGAPQGQGEHDEGSCCHSRMITAADDARAAPAAVRSAQQRAVSPSPDRLAIDEEEEGEIHSEITANYRKFHRPYKKPHGCDPWSKGRIAAGDAAGDHLERDGGHGRERRRLWMCFLSRARRSREA